MKYYRITIFALCALAFPVAAMAVTDFNSDGATDFADFLILSANFGTETGMTTQTGDTDGDGDVDFPDFLTFSAAFGTSTHTRGEWDPITKQLRVEVVSGEKMRLTNTATGNVKLEDPDDATKVIGIIGDNGLCVDVAASDVIKVFVQGSSGDDTIDCSGISTTTWTSLDFVEIHGGDGADTIDGSPINDRIFGDGEDDDGKADTVNGHAGHDYVFDFKSGETMTNAKSISKIWEWKTNDISASVWNSNSFLGDIAGFTELANGNYRSKTNSAAATFERNASGDDLHVSQNYIAPAVLANGNLKMEGVASNTDEHCMFTIEESNSLTQRWYVARNKRYRLKFEITPSASTNWSTMPGVVIAQLHPGTFPPSFSTQPNPNINPPLALLISNGAWKIERKGATQDSPAKNQYVSGTSDWFTFSTSKVTVEMEFTMDYSGVNSYLRTSIGGEVVESNEQFGVNHSGVGAGQNYAAITLGTYLLKELNPSVEFSSIELFMEDD